MLGSCLRPQVSALSAQLAEEEGTRIWSVGGDGIKLYSNMLCNASFRCDQPASCRCTFRSGRTGCGSAETLPGDRSGGDRRLWRLSSPSQPCGTQLILAGGVPTAMRCDPNQRLPVISAANFENTLAICRRRTHTSHDGRHPQPVHKARPIIRRTVLLSKRNLGGEACGCRIGSCWGGCVTGSFGAEGGNFWEFRMCLGHGDGVGWVSYDGGDGRKVREVEVM
jgi:hypothetical protein